MRARRAGQAIVEEARRRGVEAIVLAAEEPSRIRGGALLGGRGGPLDNFVGDVTRYVVDKAPCRVILTAPPPDAPVAAGRPATAAGRAARRLVVAADLESRAMFVLIVGAGRVGSTVAKWALAEGHEVSVLDEDPLSHERLDNELETPGRRPAGSSRSAPRWRSTRCSRPASSAPTSFIASTDGDNTNLVVAQIAQRRFEVPKVIVRVLDPRRAEWYREQGLETVCPTQVAIDMLEQAVAGPRAA